MSGEIEEVPSAPAAPAPSVARNLQVTLLATAILGGAGFVSGVLSNRLLGPTGRGQLAAVQTAPALLAFVGALGMAEALVYNGTRNPERSRRLLSGALGVAVVGAAIATAIGWFGLALVLHAQSSETLRIARNYILGLPLLVTIVVAPSELRASGRFLSWNLWRIAPASMWAVVVVVATATHRDSVPFLVYTHLAILFVLVVPLLVMAYRRASGPARPERSDLRALARFGVPQAAQTLPQLLNLRLDQFLISAFLPGIELGLYAAAVNWCVAITLVMDACGFVLFPSLAGIDDDQERLERFCRSARLGVAVALGLSAVMAMLTPFFLTRVLGSSFKAAIPAAFVLVAANAVLGYAHVLADGMRGLGVPVVALKGELSGLAVMATSLALLLSPMGIEGAAVASLLGYTAIVTSIMVQAHRRFAVRPADLLLVRPAELRQALRSMRPGVR